MKNVLGLDIGTNSIGGALINLPAKFEDYGKEGKIEWLGSRVIPMDGDYLSKFESGQSTKAETKAAFRRQKRGARRLKHRYKLRRTRLIKVFKALGWMGENFPLDDSKGFKRQIRENEGFKFSINDYLPLSQMTVAEFEREFGIEGKKSRKKGSRKGGKSIVPEDWIIYYLRKKALTGKIEIPELVRIIYMMNQRRGFKSSRKDLKDTNVLPYQEFIKRKEQKEYDENGIETQFVSITKIKSVIFKEEKKDKRGEAANVYTVLAEDSRMESWEEIRKQKPEWEGKEFTFLVVQKVDKNGNFYQNKPQIPKEDNWGLCTTALDEKINEHTYPGKYFYDELKKAYLDKRNFKIRQYPVYRWRYKKELEDIWKKQCELNQELKKINTDQNILTRLVGILYPTQAKNNMPKLAEFKSHDLLYIISDDIIYYQRELKSQKNSIGECRYEKRKGIDGELYGLKCIPRSSPLFQEFRIWQDIHNIRILEREVKEDEKTRIDIDVTDNFIDENVKENLFELFNSKLTISEKDILKLLINHHPNCNIRLDIDKKEKLHTHRINLFANRDELKGNETLCRYKKLFERVEFNGSEILSDKDELMKLWHIDYSITSSDEEKSKKGITTALSKLLPDLPNKDEAIGSFCSLSELRREYGSYSAMAIKKMLPVMRCGKYWEPIEKLIEQWEQRKNEASKQKQRKEIDDYIKSLSDIHRRASQIHERLNSIGYNSKRISEIADDDIQKQVLKSLIGKQDLSKGLGTYQAGYLIYDKHSEKDKTLISTPEEFGKYIQKEIPNNSLRNPIVEQVIRETMFLVRDIWKRYGEINEIHIELGRELKNNADERKKIADVQKGNFEEKKRIRKLLYELLNGGFKQYTDENIIEDAKFEVKPNPESPMDIDKFRIWKSLSKYSDADWEKKVKEEKIPTDQQVKKYTLWLSQNCRSPYTGKIIPLSKLFDPTQYEIEHIIPRRKLKNDSFNNLVIAEWGVNKAKDNQLAVNFIANSKGKCSYGGVEYKLFAYEEYDDYCRQTFKHQKSKRKNLLTPGVPEDFIERQINDTRYIGRKLAELLTPVIKKVDGTLNENGLIFTIGSITSELRNNWGLNSVWKDIVRPRFARLEAMMGKKFIIPDGKDPNKYHFNVPENPELELKRIDHRHHALDALIIAATTREHIRYLNTLSAADSDDDVKKCRLSLVKGKIRDFKEPWSNFTRDAKDKLEETIVTFKTNNRIVSQPRNKIYRWIEKGGKLIKTNKDDRCIQKTNSRWMSVRRSMFKEPLGVIWLKETKEVSVYDAFEVHIKRKLADLDTEKRKTAAYIYDKQARKIIDDIIIRTGFSPEEHDAVLNEIKKFLKKNSKKVETGRISKTERVQYKTVYILNGIEYEKITIAHFVSYKTKRMALAKKEYVENLTIEKMKNDFPYFSENEERNNAFNNLFIRHIKEYNNAPKEAFGAEGLEKLNKKAIDTPAIGKEIKSVTRLDGKIDLEDMFNNGVYETDKGAMAYFVIYENQETKEREYPEPGPSIAAHKAIEKIVKGQPIAENREGFDTIILSPGDLVYVPTKEETEKIRSGAEIQNAIAWDDKKYILMRIYKIVSFSKKDLLCIKADVADPIIPYDRKNKTKGEIGWDNKSAATMDSDVTIKDVCIKLKMDRIGNVVDKKQNINSFKMENANLFGRSEYNKKSEEKISIAKEPTISYPNKVITFFQSIEEENEHTWRQYASMTSEERLAVVTGMRITAFPYLNSELRPWGNTLYFD